MQTGSSRPAYRLLLMRVAFWLHGRQPSAAGRTRRPRQLAQAPPRHPRNTNCARPRSGRARHINTPATGLRRPSIPAPVDAVAFGRARPRPPGINPEMTPLTRVVWEPGSSRTAQSLGGPLTSIKTSRQRRTRLAVPAEEGPFLSWATPAGCPCGSPVHQLAIVYVGMGVESAKAGGQPTVGRTRPGPEPRGRSSVDIACPSGRGDAIDRRSGTSARAAPGTLAGHG